MPLRMACACAKCGMSDNTLASCHVMHGLSVPLSRKNRVTSYSRLQLRLLYALPRKPPCALGSRPHARVAARGADLD